MVLLLLLLKVNRHSWQRSILESQNAVVDVERRQKTRNITGSIMLCIHHHLHVLQQKDEILVAQGVILGKKGASILKGERDKTRVVLYSFPNIKYITSYSLLYLVGCFLCFNSSVFKPVEYAFVCDTSHSGARLASWLLLLPGLGFGNVKCKKRSP